MLISPSPALGPSAWALKSRGLHPRQFAPWAARSARAHQENSARARQGVGCPLRPLRGHLPRRGRRDLALRKPLVAHLLGSPSGGRYVPVGRCPAADRGGSRDAGTAAAVTERATAPPSGKGGAKGPCFPSFFRLPPTKGKGKVVGRCPTPCKPFEKGLTENFMLALPWFFPHLSSSGTYFWSTGKARYAGRIIRPPVVSSSMRWAHQPAMRLTANMGVNKSSGMPSISYTSPE